MCGGKVSFRYFVVELSTAVIFGTVGWQWGISLLTLRYCILTLALIIAVGTDLSHQEIPDQVSLGTSCTIGDNCLGYPQLGQFDRRRPSLLPVASNRHGQSRRHGRRDIKLALGIGLALGWKLGLVTLAVAFLAGGLLAVVLMIRGKRGKAIPFGPFLALGAWVAMFFGDALLDLYVAFSLSLWSW